MTYADHIYPFAPTGRNGRPRRPGEAITPAGIVHDTESPSAMSTIRYLDSLNDPKQRAAGYPSLADETGLVPHHRPVGMGDVARRDPRQIEPRLPRSQRLFGCLRRLLQRQARDRNDHGNGSAKKPATKSKPTSAKHSWTKKNIADSGIERVYSGDLYKGAAYLADKRAGTVHGFYGHGDVAPHSRVRSGLVRQGLGPVPAFARRRGDAPQSYACAGLGACCC